MRRVAFTLIGGKNWTGGYNYLLNLLQALARYESGAIVPVLFFGEDVGQDEIAPFRAISGVEVVCHSAFDVSRKGLALVKSLLLGRDAATQNVFQKYRINLVFESAQFHGWRATTPAIAWIPDLQHRFLPHLFGFAGYWKRELGFLAQIACKRTIMVSSDDTRSHCERLYPSALGRIHTVHFAVPGRAAITRTEARKVADRYGLPQHYFFMPNQFWQHKNHKLVLEALALLEREGDTRVSVIASGKTQDPRNPDYYSQLQAMVESLGIGDRFKSIGMIAYEDLAPLMMASDALLNPSGFEGWSTTVEEARALGVPMVLSDLDVHREQGADQATYFDRTSAQALAQTLSNYVPLDDEKRDALAAQAVPLADARVSEFARAFVALVSASMVGAD